jgi:hypothetical protein
MNDESAETTAGTETRYVLINCSLEGELEGSPDLCSNYKDVWNDEGVMPDRSNSLVVYTDPLIIFFQSSSSNTNYNIGPTDPISLDSQDWNHGTSESPSNIEISGSLSEYQNSSSSLGGAGGFDSQVHIDRSVAFLDERADDENGHEPTSHPAPSHVSHASHPHVSRITEPDSEFQISTEALADDDCRDELKDDIEKIIDSTAMNTAANSFQVGAQLHEMTDSINNSFVTKVWDGCKTFIEKSGDEKAKQTVKQWTQEKMGLAKAIEVSLKEYADIYEKATAVRLYFEQEKQKFEQMVKVRGLSHQNADNIDQMERRIENDNRSSYYGGYNSNNQTCNSIVYAQLEELEEPNEKSPTQILKKRQIDDFAANNENESSNINSKRIKTKPFYSPLKEKL